MFNQYVAFGWKWHGPRKHTKKIKIEILIASRLKRRNIKSTSKYWNNIFVKGESMKFMFTMLKNVIETEMISLLLYITIVKIGLVSGWVWKIYH